MTFKIRLQRRQSSGRTYRRTHLYVCYTTIVFVCVTFSTSSDVGVHIPYSKWECHENVIIKQIL